MPEWKLYKKKALQMMRDYIPGEDLSKTSVAPGETPEEGDKIACDESGSQWLIKKWFVDEKYEQVDYNPV
jgi:hypothetical protein